MYLLINGVKHTCKRRIKKADSIQYLSVSPKPEEITGIIQMYAEVQDGDDFLLSEDNTENYKRKYQTGTLLTLTNAPERKPEDQTKKPEYRLSMLEAEREELAARLAETDEIMDIMLGGV